jgi:hypothetical protein
MREPRLSSLGMGGLGGGVPLSVCGMSKSILLFNCVRNATLGILKMQEHNINSI